MNRLYWQILVSILLFLPIQTMGGLGGKIINSFLGIELGMSFECVDSIINTLEISDYETYSDHIAFKYEVIKDGIEQNIIRILFLDDTVNEVQILFFSYNMSDFILKNENKRFESFIDKVDETYETDIGWKGMWTSKDKKIKAETAKIDLGGKIYDALIIGFNKKKKNRKHSKEETEIKL